MTATTDFIAERLLQRAIVTIRDMRDVMGIPPGRTAADALIDISTVAAAVDHRPNQEVRR